MTSATRRSLTHRVLRITAALAMVALIAQPTPARAEFHKDARGNPFHMVGHLLAPVGQAFGFLIVEPFYWVVDSAPGVFGLN